MLALMQNQSVSRLLSTLVLSVCTFFTPVGWALSVDDAKHLALRTSFAATPDLMHALLPLSREEAVDYVMTRVEPNPVEPPEFVVNPPIKKKYNELTSKKRDELRKLDINRRGSLKAWWFERMTTTRAPLQEQLLLFWHNHFTTSSQKVKDPIMLYQQHELLRNQALGRFDLMLRLVMQDPAMLNYLDNSQNEKGKPNENLARELLELYTLGEGNYTEKDIKETARALTGWSTDNASRSFRLKAKQHDNGRKTILGESGGFTMPQVLDLLLKRPETAELITTKLWQQFISPTPNQDRVAELATAFKNHQYDIRRLLKQLLMEDAFWAKENRANLVKSPVELLVGLFRQLNIQFAPYHGLAVQSKLMGQDLFTPPNVKGWPVASTEWINTASLLKRQNAINRFMRAKEMNNKQQDEGMLYEAANTWAQSEQFNYQKDWLLAMEPVTDIEGNRPILTLRNLLNDPVYQLK
ncbi:DUF1800 domain-containing protein [Neptunomonas phycophila]|uniref:DUF1800 domain-containing protein n=1 Tax=Neptunomonas phycophila TaxID=1572645 RepID=A0AAW7XN44_9GAMM|nr:DUF1800 domain-containing protein [Neptunomonas phycophila]MDO6454358.1 DUF1800 domain-containing protein [Neptunomonas phycophila]